jgi:hypothetical protein
MSKRTSDFKVGDLVDVVDMRDFATVATGAKILKMEFERVGDEPTPRWFASLDAGFACSVACLRLAAKKPRAQVGEIVFPCFSMDEARISGLNVAISPLAHVEMQVTAVLPDGKIWCGSPSGAGSPVLVRSWVCKKHLALASRLDRLQGRASS